jgi:hypothetical protein
MRLMVATIMIIFAAVLAAKCNHRTVHKIKKEKLGG